MSVSAYASPGIEPGLSDVHLSLPAPSTGTCFIVRRSPGCGCCPDEATYYGPWLEKANAQAFADERKKHGEDRDRHFEVGQNIPYEIAGRFLILKDRYALDRGFIDGSNGDEIWDKEMEDYGKLYTYF